MVNIEDSLGIPNYGPWYLEVNSKQNDVEEFLKISDLVRMVVQDDRIVDFQGKKHLQFINYGKTELVFVLTVDEKRQYTLLVKQPAVEFGMVKKEFDNLVALNDKYNFMIVKPLYYFALEEEDFELYVTEYCYQTRCIGVETTDWGMWVPEPVYHFRTFTEEERSIVNSVMVARLVELYDEEQKCGLANCYLDGGDFMLEKEFEDQPFDYSNILKNIKLCAARELLNMEFSDYLTLLKEECMGNTQFNNTVLAKPLKCKMSEDEVEFGIQLGLSLRKEIEKRYIKKK